jgi:hypothetical protein
MAEQTKVARARQQLDDALAALSDGGDDSPTSQPAGASRLVSVGETTATSQADISPDLLRTFTRLVVGTALLGIDELSYRASAWEQQAAQANAGVASALSIALDIPAPAETHAPAASGELIVVLESQPEAGPADTATLADGEIGLAMIGWIFATHERLRASRNPGHMLQAAGAQLVSSAAALVGESLGWVSGNRPARPTAAHDPQIQTWITRGRIEARHSRTLALAALNDITQDIIGALAKEPAIQNLIQSQSTTLAGEVLGEVRERTVSADIYVDSLLRRLFRRARRSPPLDTGATPAGAISAVADTAGTQL